MYLPMLASDRPLTKATDYIEDDGLWMQQKLDGMRLIVEIVTGGMIRYWGRNGQTFTKKIPANCHAIFVQLSELGSFVLDGELVGETYWVFDLLAIQNVEGGFILDESDPYRVRRELLEQLSHSFGFGDDYVRMVREATTRVGKWSLWAEVINAHGEGVVFRSPHDPYRQGKRQLQKMKFIKSIDAVVRAVGLDGHDNCEYEVYEDVSGTPITVGRCSLSGKPPVRVGDVIEVIYLYANPPTDRKPIRLYQPRLHAVRTDKAPAECLLSQIHFTDKSVV